MLTSKHVYELKSQTKVFLEMDAEIVSPALQSLPDVLVCFDVTHHMNGMNVNR
jgi:hypothetical protein